MMKIRVFLQEQSPFLQKECEMVKKILVFLSLSLFAWVLAWADDYHAAPFPRDVTFSTLVLTPLAIEGLTGDDAGNLYTTGRGANPCPVWRIPLASPALVPVGFVPGPCSPSGIAFDAKGDLFISDNDKIWTLTPNATTPPTATVYGSGVPGTNGLAFDRAGNVWTGDGTTGQGRVWKIPPGGGAGIEMFRVQPLSNEVNLNAAGVGGVGRDIRSLPPGAITVTPTTRNAQNTAGSQPLVANGVAFTHDGDLLIADTARGAIWKVELDRDGSIRARMGCDTTFAENTLCLDNILVTHPLMEGADGIALDEADNIWVAANERNAIVAVAREGRTVEIFRNPPSATTHLRNEGPLETPTSPFLLAHKFCTANSDGNRRDNVPNAAGEISPAGPFIGKISCMDQRLYIPGMRLPL
jgi:sugar lactone lactonase YvrE